MDASSLNTSSFSVKGSSYPSPPPATQEKPPSSDLSTVFSGDHSHVSPPSAGSKDIPCNQGDHPFIDRRYRARSPSSSPSPMFLGASSGAAAVATVAGLHSSHHTSNSSSFMASGLSPSPEKEGFSWGGLGLHSSDSCDTTIKSNSSAKESSLLLPIISPFIVTSQRGFTLHH